MTIRALPPDVAISLVVENQASVIYDSYKQYGPMGILDGSDLEIHMEPLLLNDDVTVRIFALNDGVSDVQGVNGQISHGGEIAL